MNHSLRKIMKKLKTQHIILSCTLCWMSYYCMQLLDATLLKNSIGPSLATTFESILFMAAIILTTCSACLLIIQFVGRIFLQTGVNSTSDVTHLPDNKTGRSPDSDDASEVVTRR